jgi:LmbE family N-acetylglucosaminyl deacetylase
MPKVTNKKSSSKKGKTKSVTKKVEKSVWSDKFGWIYLGLALFILLISVIFWSLLGAKIQSGNADQIVNSLLFANRATFAHALLPSQHTFLLKWPIFYLIHLFGVTSTTLITFTILTVILTIGLFVLILRSIEKRPLYLGTICLAMASVLMLVPAQPYAGGLLPVNMAMVAARNLEYIVYIYALILLIKSPFIKSKKFWFSIGLMAILIASDRFFFITSATAAVLAMIYYGFRNKLVIDNLVAKWLIVTVGGFIGSAITLWLIATAHITRFTNQSVGTYGFVTSLHRALLAAFYAVTGILTNLGANPASSTTIIRSMPSSIVHNFFSLGIVGYVVNIAIVIFGICIFIWEIRHSLTTKLKKSKTKLTPDYRLTVVLAWTSLAIIGGYIAINHAYSLDSRYLTITFFTIFIAITSYSRTKKLRPEALMIVGGVLLIATISGIAPTWSHYRADQTALAPISQENQTVSAILKQHHVDVLVGNYQQAISIKQIYESQKDIMPLMGCTTSSSAPTSNVWRPSLRTNSFAYILNLKYLNNSIPTCSLRKIIQVYGSPNSATLISGNISKPKALLLFFDHGVNKIKYAAKTSSILAVTTTPLLFSDLPSVSCTVPTLMTVVAHQDDDLLFMNPDLSKQIAAGYCDRAIYLTAGDDGKSADYWLGRQLGSEAAYSTMLGLNRVWVERNVELANNEYIVIANPAGDSNISLIFFHLPDGNLNGQGFASSNFESLADLYSGKISSIQTVDHQSSYTANSLVSALVSLMHYYQPSEIWTQSDYFKTGDHSDHITTGKFATESYNAYEQQQYQDLVTIPIVYFAGYPIRSLPDNVSGQELAFKIKIFTAYAKHDANICNTGGCYNLNDYSGYFTKQYIEPY